MINKLRKYNIQFYNYSFSFDSIVKNPLFSGSAIMVVGSNFANFIAYIYHLVFGRILGPASYGELVSSISIIALIMSAISFFGIVIVKFVSSSQDNKIPVILGWFNKKTLIVAVIVSLFVFILSPFIGEYSRLPKSINLLFAPIIFVSIIVLVYKSFLQGVMKFKEVVILSNTEFAGRFLFGLLFIYLNLRVFGALLGMIIASTIAVFLAKIFLKDVGFSNKKIKDFNIKTVARYSLPVFVVTFTFTSMLSSDLVLVKHFFTSYEAGIYGSVSNLGKIIFYGTAPIGTVMFPIISNKMSKGARYVNVFLLSAFMMIGIGLVVLALYLIFPETVMTTLYGNGYLEGTKYLYWMGGYFIIYSLANLMSSFLLSIERVGPLYFLPCFAVAQIILIYLFHETFLQVIFSSAVSISLLLLYLVIYFAYAKRNPK